MLRIQSCLAASTEAVPMLVMFTSNVQKIDWYHAAVGPSFPGSLIAEQLPHSDILNDKSPSLTSEAEVSGTLE